MTTFIPDLPPSLQPRPPARRDQGRTASLEVVVPVHNEERVLSVSVRRLHAHLADQLPYPFRITIADNASTDGTLAVAHELADALPGVTVLHLDRKGRGLAL